MIMCCALFYSIFNDDILKYFSCKIHNLDSTDDGEPCEQAHGSSYSRQLVHKLDSPVLGDAVKCGGVEIYSNKL